MAQTIVARRVGFCSKNGRPIEPSLHFEARKNNIPFAI